MMGRSCTTTFTSSGADPYAPYTNTGGIPDVNPPGPATLTLQANGFTGTEPGNAIQGGGNQISLDILGSGRIVLLGPNGYTGATTIFPGGTLALATITSVGEFAPPPTSSGSIA